jgi:NADPH:quinone reductase
MQAIVHDPAAPDGLRRAEVPDPVPAPDQAVVAVAAASLNFLDIAYRAGRLAPGAVPGVDAAGTVLAAAPDGSGPPAGTRVAGFGPGAWAQRVALRTADLAVVPDAVPLEVAAALPAAGVTALRAVRALGPLLGRRVLVTGSSGGVGRFAVQLAARSGAEVVALVGSAARGEGLAGLGAGQVLTDLDRVGPVDHVLDNVGGPLLAAAFALVTAGGAVLSIGQASLEPTVVDFEAERRRGAGRRIEPFVVGADLGPDLAVLLDLAARDGLDPQVGWRGSWDRVGEAAAALRDRKLAGKAVLEVA